LSANFRGKRVIHQRILALENLIPWAITWCLRDPTFSRFDTIPVCDGQTHRQTDTQTHDDGYYPRRASCARVKTAEPIEIPFGDRLLAVEIVQIHC